MPLDLLSPLPMAFQTGLRGHRVRGPTQACPRVYVEAHNISVPHEKRITPPECSRWPSYTGTLILIGLCLANMLQDRDALRAFAMEPSERRPTISLVLGKRHCERKGLEIALNQHECCHDVATLSKCRIIHNGISRIHLLTVATHRGSHLTFAACFSILACEGVRCGSC